MPRMLWGPTHKQRKHSGARNFDAPFYLAFRKAVRTRDGYRCRMCHAYDPVTRKWNNSVLVVHHILRWADFPALRFTIANGITLCRRCHDRVTGDEGTYVPLLTLLANTPVLDTPEHPKKKGRGRPKKPVLPKPPKQPRKKRGVPREEENKA